MYNNQQSTMNTEEIEIVINVCYGGFSLSDMAMNKYISIKNLEKYQIREEDIKRDDKDLVKIVKQLGSDAYGTYAELKIVKIPADVDWMIEEYDGKEYIAEKHRTWH